MRPPEVSYARSGDVAIAYQIVGRVPPDLVFVRGTTGDLVSTWEQPLLIRHAEGLAKSTRVLMLDKRGTGLSDRPREVQSIETTMEDVRAVMNVVDYVAEEGSNNIAITADVDDSAALQVMLAAPPAEVQAQMDEHGVVAPIRTYKEAWPSASLSTRAGRGGSATSTMVRSANPQEESIRRLSGPMAQLRPSRP